MEGEGCRVQGVECRVQGVRCRVQGSGCRVQGAGCRVQGVGLGSRCRVYLAHSVLKGVLRKSIPTQIRQFIPWLTDLWGF